MRIVLKIVTYLAGLLLCFLGVMAFTSLFMQITADPELRKDLPTLAGQFAANAVFLCLGVYFMSKAFERTAPKTNWDKVDFSDRLTLPANEPAPPPDPVKQPPTPGNDEKPN